MSADKIAQRVVCAWCQTTLREGPEPTSHGICNTCDERVRQEMEQLKPRMGEQTDEAKQQQ